MDCSRGWIVLLAFGFLWGCAPTGEAVIFDREILRLQSQAYTIQQEKDALSHQLDAFRKEAQNDISALKEELAFFQKEPRRLLIFKDLYTSIRGGLNHGKTC